MTTTIDNDGQTPAAVCRACGYPMPAAHLLCAFCLTDGKTPTDTDIHARNARIAEIVLWS